MIRTCPPASGALQRASPAVSTTSFTTILGVADSHESHCLTALHCTNHCTRADARTSPGVNRSNRTSTEARAALARSTLQVISGPLSCSAGATYAASDGVTFPRSSHIRCSNGGSGMRRIGEPATRARAAGTARRTFALTRATPRSAETTSASRCAGANSASPGREPGRDRLPSRVVGGVVSRQHRGIDHRQAHDASRTYRTAATASSSDTPVCRGGT
jgi:hypothetical protein